MVSVLELPGSVLIVPQATLGGKSKGRAMQYHNNISKEDGLRLYGSFISLCEKELTAAASAESGAEVKHGTYGNRQVLKLDTNGPYTHLMEFWPTGEDQELDLMFKYLPTRLQQLPMYHVIYDFVIKNKTQIWSLLLFLCQ